MSTRFVKAESLPEALDLLARYGDGARLLAGGASLALMIREKQIAPALLVGIERVPALDYVLAASDGLRLGPLARLRDIELDPNSTTRFHLPQRPQRYGLRSYMLCALCVLCG